MSKIGRIKDALKLRNGLKQLIAAAGHITIYALFILVAEADAASPCFIQHLSHPVHHLAPEGLFASLRHIERKHANIARTKPQEFWDGYEDNVKFLNTMYNEGLISPDFATDSSSEQLNQAVTSGMAGGYSANYDHPIRITPGILAGLQAQALSYQGYADEYEEMYEVGNLDLIPQSFHFEKSIAADGQYNTSLKDFHREILTRCTMCKPEEVHDLFVSLQQEYLNRGGQAVIDERTAAWDEAHPAQ